MTQILTEPPDCVLGVYAHPDCPMVAAGGSFATWAAQGAQVHLVICTRGERGGDDAAAAVSDLVAARSGEVERAAGFLGLASVEILDFPDGDLRNTAELRLCLVERIRRIRPDTVVGHDPTAVFFGDRYVNHPDHRELGWASLDAVTPGAGGARYYPGAGAPHTVAQMLLSGTLEPDLVVDIGGSLDAKIRAVLEHRSVSGEEPTWLPDSMAERAGEAGRTVGLEAGEAFRRLRLEA